MASNCLSNFLFCWLTLNPVLFIVFFLSSRYSIIFELAMRVFCLFDLDSDDRNDYADLGIWITLFGLFLFLLCKQRIT